MKLSLRDARRLAIGAALACGTILLPMAVLAISPASGAPARVVGCKATNTAVWAAAESVGTAGTTYFELEFSNIGTQACTLHGFPDVWAVTSHRVEIGKPASHQKIVPITVTLQPGATAHAILGVVDTGAVCGRQGVKAAGLRVVPPGEPMPVGGAVEVDNLAVQVCPHVSSMNVRPVHSGTGIPGYTSS